jgi:hypothetical protein
MSYTTLSITSSTTLSDSDHLPQIISGISGQAALDPPCLPAANTLVCGSSSRGMDSLPQIGAQHGPLCPPCPLQQPTSNARRRIRHWMLDVRYWMLDVRQTPP